MDPELLKQREQFKKKAAAVPVISKKPDTSDEFSQDLRNTSRRESGPKNKLAGNSKKNTSATEAFDYKTVVASSSSSNFSILTKLIDYLKKRYLELEGNTWSLGLDEILRELLMFDLSKSSREWLRNVAMPNNPRISVDTEGRFDYKPPYNVKGPKSLLRLLKNRDQCGSGGVLLSALTMSMSNPEEALAKLGNSVLVFPTQHNKRKDKVIFYNDTTNDEVVIDEEFKGLWRTVNLEHIDEQRVEEHLGLPSEGGKGVKRKPELVKRRGKKRAVIVHNDHMQDVLKDIS